MSLLFGKNKVNLEKMEVDDPDGFLALMNAAKSMVETDENVALTKANAKIVVLEAAASKVTTDAKIIAFGEKLKVSAIAAKAIEDGNTLAEAMELMINGNAATVEDVETSFKKTSSIPVGGSKEDGNEDEPKSFGEAIVMIKERDKSTSMEASRKATKEYPDLFKKRAAAPVEDDE